MKRNTTYQNIRLMLAGYGLGNIFQSVIIFNLVVLVLLLWILFDFIEEIQEKRVD